MRQSFRANERVHLFSDDEEAEPHEVARVLTVRMPDGFVFPWYEIERSDRRVIVGRDPEGPSLFREAPARTFHHGHELRRPEAEHAP